MTRHIQTFAGLALVISAISAGAQISHNLRVSVPFSFVAGATVSPAGDYRLEIDRSRDVVTLTSPDLKSIFLLTQKKSEPDDARTYLRFHRYGDEWFLEEVTTGGIGQKVLQGKTQRNMITAMRTSDDKPLIADIAIH